MKIGALLAQALQVALEAARPLLIVQLVVFGPVIATTTALVAWADLRVLPYVVVVTGASLFVAHSASSIAVSTALGGASVAQAVRVSLTAPGLWTMAATYLAAGLGLAAVGGYGAAVAWSLEYAPTRMMLVALGGVVWLLLGAGGALLLFTRWALASSLVVVESLGARRALARSAALTRGRQMRIFVLGLVVISVWLALATVGAVLIPTVSPPIGKNAPDPATLLDQQWKYHLLWTSAMALVLAYSGALWTVVARMLSGAE